MNFRFLRAAKVITFLLLTSFFCDFIDIICGKMVWGWKLDG
jgi:hypothetical protein